MYVFPSDIFMQKLQIFLGEEQFSEVSLEQFLVNLVKFYSSY